MPRTQKAAVDIQDNIRSGQNQQVVIILQVIGITRHIRKTFPAVILLSRPELLDIGAHGAIQDNNPFAQLVLQIIKAFDSGCSGHMARKIYRSSAFGTRTIGVTPAMETAIHGQAFLNPSIYSRSVPREWMENPYSGRGLDAKYPGCRIAGD